MTRKPLVDLTWNEDKIVAFYRVVVVCLHRLWFHCLSSQILVVICGGLRWFAVMCGGFGGLR